ncbi:MAG: hypothetical protein ACR2LU_13765 [Luteitalea sp.]
MSLTCARPELDALLQSRRLDGTLAGRVPSTGWLSTGVPALDTSLAGGWPRGHVSEIVGPPSSGRTRVLVSTLVAATTRGDIAAWIDTVDRGDPAAAAAAGVRLPQVLWVRGTALSPGLLAARPRRGDPDLTFTAVQRAVKAAHLVTQAGGFGLVVLDLCDIPSAVLRQLPSSTWLRLQRAIEGRETTMVVLGGEPVTRSAGGVSVRVQGRPRWDGSGARSCRLTGMDCALRVVSSRVTPGSQREVQVALAG